MRRVKAGKGKPFRARVIAWRDTLQAVSQDADGLAELAASLDEAAGFPVARPEVIDLVAVLRATADSLAKAVDRAETLRVGVGRYNGSPR